MDKESLELLNRLADDNSSKYSLIFFLKTLSLLEKKDLATVNKISIEGRNSLKIYILLIGFGGLSYYVLRKKLLFSFMNSLLFSFSPVIGYSLVTIFTNYNNKIKLDNLLSKYRGRVFHFNKTLNVIDINPDFLDLDDKEFSNLNMLKLKHMSLNDGEMI